MSLTTDDLKAVLPVMILYNLEAPWLCNNTKLIVKRQVVMQTVVKQTHRQKTVEAISTVLSPRIPLIPLAYHLPSDAFKFHLIALAMTIKNSQGQIFK